METKIYWQKTIWRDLAIHSLWVFESTTHVSFVCRVFLVRWTRYNPYYLEPEVRKEAYSRPEAELSPEEQEQQKLKTHRPIKAATNGVTSSLFDDPVLR